VDHYYWTLMNLAMAAVTNKYFEYHYAFFKFISLYEEIINYSF